MMQQVETGKWNLRLCDLMDIEKDIIQSEQHLFIISAGTSAGKTTLIEGYHGANGDYTGLAEKFKVALITSRKQKVKETTAKHHDSFLNDLREIGALIHWDSENRNVTCTNAHIYQYAIEHFNKDNKLTYFWREFDFIVIDECHSICTDAPFAHCALTVKHLIEAVLSDCQENGIKTKIILMTATPEPIEWMYEELKGKVFDFRQQTSFLKPSQINVLSYELIKERIGESISKNETTMYYMAHLDKLFDLIKYAKTRGMDEEQIAVSISDKSKLTELKRKYPIVYKNMELLETTLSQEEVLPSRFKLILTNGKCKEAINIRTVIDFLVIESHYFVDIKQIYGRFRLGVKDVSVVSDARQFRLNEHFEQEVEYYESNLLKDNEGFQKRNRFREDIIYPTLAQSESALKYVNALLEQSHYRCFNVFEQKFVLNDGYIHFKEHYEKSITILEKAIDKRQNWARVDDYFLNVHISYPSKIEPYHYIQQWFSKNRLILGNSILKYELFVDLIEYLKKALPQMSHTPKKNYKSAKPILKVFGCEHKIVGRRTVKENSRYLVSPLVEHVFKFNDSLFHQLSAHCGELWY